MTSNGRNSEPRFASQAATAEDLLKSQTVGLVNLSEFRKRRAEAIEQSFVDASDGDSSHLPSQTGSGAATPVERSLTPQSQTKKKRKVAKGKLSFAVDHDEEQVENIEIQQQRSKTNPTVSKAEVTQAIQTTIPARDDDYGFAGPRRRLGPNASIVNAPKIMTKSALLKEAQTREQLRKEFLTVQEAVKATEIVIPFVFYDGTNLPGGACRVKKGDHIWLFLDRCRKIGAELGVGASGEARSRREWARVGVDDLMLVRRDIIIPHHYEFYYFIVNKVLGRDSRPIFAYSSESTTPNNASTSVSAMVDLSTYNPLFRPGEGSHLATPLDTNIEGAKEDPNLTKVVNRQWYERNKHIFPASKWEEFDPAKDYTTTMRKDAQGNTFFFPG